MCKHILCARLIPLALGPMTSYKMELTEIDSSSEGGNDIMEVVASLDATPMTRELLLDTFMQGFLHELFLSKWRRFAGSIYYLLRTIDFAYLLVVLYQGFVLKQNPYANVTPATYASLALASVLAFVEFSACFLWWRNESQCDIRSLRSAWQAPRVVALDERLQGGDARHLIHRFHHWMCHLLRIVRNLARRPACRPAQAHLPLLRIRLLRPLPIAHAIALRLAFLPIPGRP